MKQTRFANAALALALAVALAACHSAAPEETPPSSVVPGPVETAGPVQSTPAPPPEPPVWGEQTFSREFCAGDGTPVLQVSYTLPMVQNAAACPAGAAINAWYQAEGQARLTEAEEQHEAQVADYDVSSALGFPFEPTVEEMRSEVVYEDRGVVSVRRERDRGRKANGNSPHPGQIAQVHGQRLPADILGREIRAPEMRSLHEQIGAHAQQTVPVQHGTVVPPAETHAGTRGRFRKKMINAGQHMVFGSKRRAHTAP